jgi:cystathionine gamma-synthase
MLAGLEGGTVAAAFSSGLAAIGAVFQALAPGDHVIAPDILYHGTTRILKDIFVPWNLQVSFVDMTDERQVREAVEKNTKIIFIETPANPTLAITDIKAIARIAQAAGAQCVCDNTWATPVLQRPLALGADLVVHSTTKYFGGHSDVLGGAIVGRRDDAYFERIRKIQQLGGAVPSPFDAWLLLRGAQTLPCRIRNHAENAAKLAEFLSGHPCVERVHYPGLPAHPGHAIARRQMSLFGGMLSFEVKGGRQQALAVTGKLKVITRGTSLGGVESLIEHRASVEGPESKTPDNLLRLSVGLEAVEDLIADFEDALNGSR